ncbi:APO protein 3, mitochondrial isoform X2 [Nymphaea colorata]|nr:APO protein 3, mitochondrial isoform X2 [Nymphaea colorata]XP_031498345.1 APO protein 3, mitochondrial isoform X2 [Nymphaea colorata]XP_031498353.1 APO protein 3, mitochondrial isoform X2 [Nymphaea colorata]XP_031498375.1 APO protein 3, mitochondrial isoform X2 [Nymphaea colorata]XP_049933306.1 APO protein 3, mitochondrial isoform X2 [Nymphaea colorata]
MRYYYMWSSQKIASTRGRLFLYSRSFFSSDTHKDLSYVDLPRPARDKSKRKPYPTPMKVLIQRAKLEKEARKLNPCRTLEPPDNGLLIPEFVPIAHQVYKARTNLLDGLSKLLNVVDVKRCRFCSEVHVGHVGHEIRTCTGPRSGLRNAMHVWTNGKVVDVVGFPLCFHLDDRAKKPRVVHDERSTVKRLPAIVELCIQAGLDLPKYPTMRRTRPVHSIEGRIVEFDDDSASNNDIRDEVSMDLPGSECLDSEELTGDITELSIKILESWFIMKNGAEELMKKFSVQTCGYCPEVQVGPKGHKVRMCKAAKHQFRDGLHAWQEATIEDIIGMNYVWHVRDRDGPALRNELKRYYGKAPAVVELCVQAGAPIPDEFRSMMRLDVVSPDRDEVDLVA